MRLMCQPGISRTWLPRSQVPRPFSKMVGPPSLWRMM